ncbi:GGDEF domain-containing protein, partial [Candidatus Gracilibacteria bacterium]|nr:GGDEF domain-containing protein [Candidatus Gracilibacteria bacterium]
LIVKDLIDRVKGNNENITHLMNLVFYLLSYTETVNIDLIDELIDEINDRQIYDYNFGMNLEAYRISEMQKSIKSYKAIQGATIDELTGVKNRRAFDESLEEFSASIEREKNEDQVHAVVIFDIDHFKLFNDKYGHVVGDQVLKFFSNTIKDAIRKTDKFFRYGGEEFSMLITCDTVSDIEKKLNNIREEIKINGYEYKGEILQVTTSVGAVCLTKEMIDENIDIVERADLALYLAKETGRNKVLIYNDNTEEELSKSKKDNLN